jgi:hypothetical protein
VGQLLEGGSIHLTLATIRRTVLVPSIAALALAVAAGCAYPSTARSACADAILEDWTQGMLEPTYPADCYDEAIDALPDDLRAYTTAADDISRVAVEAGRETPVRRLASTSSADTSVRAFPVEIVFLGVLVAALAATGLGAALLRRRRPH